MPPEKRLVDPEDLMGYREVCQILGWSDSHVSKIIREDPNFPTPVRSVTATHLWLGEEVREWRSQRVKASAGRKSRGVKQAEDALEAAMARIEAKFGAGMADGGGSDGGRGGSAPAQ